MTTIQTKNVGKRIKNIRFNLKEKKMSLESFGKLLNPPATKGLVKKWEDGNNLPSPDRLNQIARIAGVSVEYLVYGKQINGYGDKIRKIREEQLKLSKFDFARTFSNSFINSNNSFFTHINFDIMPIEEIIEAWENENLLPTREQLEMIATMGDTTVDELLWNEKPNNVVQSVKISEEKLKEKNLSYLEEAMNEHLIDILLAIKLEVIKDMNSSELIKSILYDLLEALSVDKEILKENKIEMIKNFTEKYSKLIEEQIK